jgi:uncharacterized protein (DUF1330 family)
MSAYMVVQIKMIRREGMRDYRNAVGPLAQKFGGHYRIAGGVTVEVLEGSHDGRSFVLFEFPSMEAIHRFWNSAEYAAVKKLREGAADLDVWAVPGVVPSIAQR